MSRPRSVLTKQVVAINPADLTCRPLASFRLLGDYVAVEWHDACYRREVEAIGIMTCEGALRPADGRRFFEALDIAYANSTFIDVVEMPRPKATTRRRRTSKQRPTPTPSPGRENAS